MSSLCAAACHECLTSGSGLVVLFGRVAGAPGGSRGPRADAAGGASAREQRVEPAQRRRRRRLGRRRLCLRLALLRASALFRRLGRHLLGRFSCGLQVLLVKYEEDSRNCSDYP